MCLLIFITWSLLSFGYFSTGILEESGVIIGLWDPAAFLTFTKVPIDSSDSFLKIRVKMDRPGVHITSITSDPNKEVVFFAMENNIYIYKKFSVLQDRTRVFPLLFSGKSFAYGQLAFDHISSNLYWCDALLGWIAMKPAFSFDETIYKVVVHELHEPLGLALDSEDSVMFFSNNGPNSQIERTSLDGQNRAVIVYRGLTVVYSLSVDVLNNKLYWADHTRQTLEVSDYDGLNRRVIRRMDDVSPTDLFYYQNMLYVVSAKEQEMYVFDVTSGLQLFSEAIYSGQPQVIHVYDTSKKRSPQDLCLDLLDLDCDHMCVNTKPKPKCICAEGYILDDDEESCTEKSVFFERGFIVNNESMFVMHDVHSVNGRKSRKLFEMFSNVETFAVDAKSDYIYFIDSKNKSLKKLDMISTVSSTLAFIPSGRDLVFDWLTNILGWIESASKIVTFTLPFGTTSTIYSNLQQLDSLTVNSHNGALYWISGPMGARSIVHGTWKRDPPSVLISEANLDNPISLQYDVTSNRIYWFDRSQFKSSKTNGLDIKSHNIAMDGIKLFSYKEYFGWITRNQIYFTRKSVSATSEYIFNTVQNAKNVIVFDSLMQKDRRGTCHILNGGCEDICIPVTNGRRCACDLGLQIQKDNTCYSDPLKTSFIVGTDVMHNRILQIDLKTGSVVKIPITATAAGIAFDKSTKTLFFSDILDRTIMSTTFQGQNMSSFYSSGFSYAYHLAIDFSTGNIFYSSVGKNLLSNYIGAVHRTSFHHKEVLFLLNAPRELAVYPSKGFLFWVEPHGTPSIGRAYMDGTEKVYIVTQDLKRPNSLAIDYSSNQLYWTDRETNRIEFSDLNGGNRHILATDSEAQLMSLEIHGQYLYYAAKNRQRITKMDKSTGSKVPFMTTYPELGQIDSMDIYADDFLDVSSSCSHKNGMCSSFCFPTPYGRTCGCQDNVHLQSDQMTCEGVVRCPTELQNLKVLDCPPYPGQSCDFTCKPGYRSTVKTTVSCLSDGHWAPPVDTLCEVILCPSYLENAVLSSGCLRRPGDSCSFSCASGHHPLTSNNMVCNSDGTWNQDTKNLCSKSGCKTTIENGQLTNCQSKIGELCHYECNDPFENNPSVSHLICYSNGNWNHDTSELCVKLCPPFIKNGHLALDCHRQIGNVCSFTCNDNYKSSVSSKSIVCTSGGDWNKDTNELCVAIKCPLEIPSGHLSSVCRGLVGEICALYCDDKTMESVHVVCSSAGLWDKDISTICTPDSHSQRKQIKEDAGSNIYMYLGSLAGGVIVIIILCLKNTRH